MMPIAWLIGSIVVLMIAQEGKKYATMQGSWKIRALIKGVTKEAGKIRYFVRVCKWEISPDV